MYKILTLIISIFILFSQINVTLAEEYTEDDFFELEDYGDNDLSLKIDDPFEQFNRKVFYFNEKADKYFMRPVNKGYRFVAPKFIRTGIGNFLHNLSRPLDVANSLLQGDISNARDSFSYFLINSTIGIFGLFDIAKSKEITFKKKSFGSTLAHYNMSSGPYLVLPFLGPSNVRNFSGFLVERVIDPLSVNGLKIGGGGNILSDSNIYKLTTIRVINKYDEVSDLLEDARNNSFDLYASMRAAYLQFQN
ncbi:VacJ family lipoprotein [Rickettsiales bacterium]|nr:VacJ family lipoprotein [Rickettsiales bacterium]MDB2550560.1 VacJ family lipoprotein [Rickettsiales bacterium]